MVVSRQFDDIYVLRLLFGCVAINDVIYNLKKFIRAIRFNLILGDSIFKHFCIFLACSTNLHFVVFKQIANLRNARLRLG